MFPVKNAIFESGSRMKCRFYDDHKNDADRSFKSGEARVYEIRLLDLRSSFDVLRIDFSLRKRSTFKVILLKK